MKTTDKEFYTRKIKQLTDDKLKELLQLRSKENLHIIELAENEAIKRGIDLGAIEPKPMRGKETKTKNEKGINWPGVLADILSGLS
jgi:hypothetical protein